MNAKLLFVKMAGGNPQDTWPECDNAFEETGLRMAWIDKGFAGRSAGEIRLIPGCFLFHDGLSRHLARVLALHVHGMIHADSLPTVIPFIGYSFLTFGFLLLERVFL